MRFLKTLEASPDGAELQQAYEAAGLLRTLTESLEWVDLAELRRLINDERVEAIPGVKTLLCDLFRAIACGLCGGDTTYTHAGAEEIYRCPTCNGSGRRIPYRQRPVDKYAG